MRLSKIYTAERKLQSLMEEIAEQQIFTQQDVKYMVKFILATLERNWEGDSANTGTMPKIDQITMNWQHPYTNTNTNLTKILNF